MVRPVIHHVQQDLPERLLPGVAFEVAVRNSGLNIVIVQRGDPFLPALLNRRPFLMEPKRVGGNGHIADYPTASGVRF
jgi:hypothetical protein